jgi:hypothetical protein
VTDEVALLQTPACSVCAEFLSVTALLCLAGPVAVYTAVRGCGSKSRQIKPDCVELVNMTLPSFIASTVLPSLNTNLIPWSFRYIINTSLTVYSSGIYQASRKLILRPVPDLSLIWPFL